MTTMAKSGAKPLRYGSPSTDADAAIASLRSRLAERKRVELADIGARPAAVLVPIVASSNGLQLLCFERSHELLEHKGEICLPGGSVESTDTGVIDAALRETHEELGIAPSDVDVL